MRGLTLCWEIVRRWILWDSTAIRARRRRCREINVEDRFGDGDRIQEDLLTTKTIQIQPHGRIKTSKLWIEEIEEVL